VVKSGGVALLAMAWAPRAAALLLAGQALAKAAAFIALGAAAPLRGGRGFAQLAGLGRDQPALAAPLVVAFALAAGLPPGAPFMAEMMVVLGLAPAIPWAAMVLVALLLAGLAAWLSRLHPLLPAGTAAPLPAAAGRAAAVAWALCAACVLLGLAG
jgi:hydrogenase-4 component F